MDPLLSSEMMPGRIVFCLNNTQGCFLLPRTPELQSRKCCKQRNWKHFFTYYPSRRMLLRNWKICSSTCQACMSLSQRMIRVVIYVWGNASYSSQRLYKLAFSNANVHPAYKWIWKASCTPRIKLFAWLVLVDRLNTKDMLRRHHCSIQDDDHCVLCSLGLVEDL